jgi:CheY-like chemotaxis protein
MKPKIIVVEDNELHAETIVFFLEELRYAILGIVDNAIDCLNLIKETNPDILLLDINILGETNGIELAEIVRNEHAVALIYTTSLIDKTTLQAAIKTQPEAYLNKPIEKKALSTAIEIALYKNKPENLINAHKS